MEQDAHRIWNASCPICRRPIHIQLSQESLSPATVDVSRGRFAYVSFLWNGVNFMESALDAMVLGHSLKTSGTKYPYILLYTEDVDARLLASLRYVGWTLRLTSYIHACDALLKHHHKSGRFAHVFTKLRALELVDFHKVLVLDTDLVIRRCVDDLFELRSPAAMKRGDSYEYRHGERIAGSHFLVVLNHKDTDGIKSAELTPV